jgi:hypothetical protein
MIMIHRRRDRHGVQLEGTAGPGPLSSWPLAFKFHGRRRGSGSESGDNFLLKLLSKEVLR